MVFIVKGLVFFGGVDLQKNPVVHWSSTKLQGSHPSTLRTPFWSRCGEAKTTGSTRGDRCVVFFFGWNETVGRNADGKKCHRAVERMSDYFGDRPGDCLEV